MRAIMGDSMACPVCGRPHRDVTLRSGDAWLVCWHQRCAETAWVVRLPAVQPVARDVELAVGSRMAASLLATFPPAPLILIAVPAAVAVGIRSASRVQVVNRLTTVLVGDGAVKPAVAPRQSAA